jgi:hypothetical protein
MKYTLAALALITLTACGSGSGSSPASIGAPVTETCESPVRFEVGHRFEGAPNAYAFQGLARSLYPQDTATAFFVADDEESGTIDYTFDGQVTRLSFELVSWSVFGSGGDPSQSAWHLVAPDGSYAGEMGVESQEGWHDRLLVLVQVDGIPGSTSSPLYSEILPACISEFYPVN